MSLITRQHFSHQSKERERVSSGASRSTLRARQSRRGSRSRGRAYPLDTCHQSQSQSSAPRFATREEHKRGECSPGLFMDCSCVCVCACVCFCSEGGGRARRTVRGSGGAACGAASERMSALSCTPNPRHSAAARRARPSHWQLLVKDEKQMLLNYEVCGNILCRYNIPTSEVGVSRRAASPR